MYAGLREDHLRYLQKWGLIRPVQRTHTDIYFPFSDLLVIRQVSAELETAPFRAIVRSLQAARSGQLTFDFRIDAEPARIIKLKRPKPKELLEERAPVSALPAPQTLAEEYFLKGSALDVDESRHHAAANWYRKALEIDPYLVPALINLANIHYGRDELAEAQALYERAIGLDPDFFEAHFNLGNIYHDLGHFPEAAGCYRTALGLNSQYADAHFYLAITLEKTGHSLEAKPHWRAYQQLSPNGEWVELAGSSLSRQAMSGFGRQSKVGRQSVSRKAKGHEGREPVKKTLRLAAKYGHLPSKSGEHLQSRRPQA